MTTMNKVRNIFGSNLHTNHSIFKKVALEYNNGGPIGFVKAAKIWFGG